MVANKLNFIYCLNRRLPLCRALLFRCRHHRPSALAEALSSHRIAGEEKEEEKVPKSTETMNASMNHLHTSF